MDQQDSAFVDVRNLGLKTPEGIVYENATFSLEEGKVCALFGSEGCGKTSLLLALGGRMKFNSGSATVCGYDLKKEFKKVRAISGVSVVERVNDVPKYLRVRDILAAELSMAGRPGNKKGVADYLDEWDFADKVDTPYNKLAARDRYLFEIMLAATTVPKLLLVDEIQKGMTHHSSLEMIELFRRLWQKKQITTVFCTNEYEIASEADCMVVLDEDAELQREQVVKKTGGEGRAHVAGFANNAEVKPVYECAPNMLGAAEEAIPAEVVAVANAESEVC